jgi:hypothetical protein
MKIKFLALAFSALFFAACGGATEADKSKEDEKKEESKPEEKAAAGMKTIEDRFNAMIAAAGEKLEYKIVEKDFDNNFMSISFKDVTADVFCWEIDAETVLFGQHTYHKNYGKLPRFFKFDGKTVTQLKEDELVNDSEKFNEYFHSGYARENKSKGSKNCCSTYGFLPKTKGGAIELVSTSETPDKLTGRPTNVDKVGTLEFSNGKFTFKKI